MLGVLEMEKAKELSHITSFTVSDFLERKAPETDKLKGYDLADYLIKFDYRQFTGIEQKQFAPITTHTGNPDPIQDTAIIPANTDRLGFWVWYMEKDFKKYCHNQREKGAKEKYINLWFHGMAGVLANDGITKEQFFNFKQTK
jgi:hypothetical protein